MQTGRIIGPASGNMAPGARSGPAPMSGLPVRRMAIAQAAASCPVYFDASYYFPGPSVSQFTIGALSVSPGGTQLGHGLKAMTAIASGATLNGDAGIGSMVQPVNALVPQSKVTGLSYYATGTGCSANMFTATLQSMPQGGGQTVVATMNSYSMVANYATSLTDMGTYFCSTGGPYFFCQVWRIDAVFSFQTASFAGNGAGAYDLAITQANLTSP